MPERELTEVERYRLFLREVTDKIKLADKLGKENAELKLELIEKDRIASFWQEKHKELKQELDSYKRKV